MFARILVPLDGSGLSARILVQVRRLLQAGARVSLLRVVDPSGPPDRGQADLARQIAELQVQGITADGEVLTGQPAAVILQRAAGPGISLVAMATHGRGGLGRWVRGSVAERVLRRCPVPLLLVNPAGRGEPDQRFRRLVVPLDGSTRAEEVLPLVARFAQVHDSEVVLLRVSELSPVPPDADPPPWAPLAPPVSREELRASLERGRERVRRAGVRVRCEAVFEDRVAEGVLQFVEREQVDLVALTTHGRSGLGRWLFGSVAEKVLRLCPVPLLVQRVGAPPPHLPDV